jgi:hypothetical protein
MACMQDPAERKQAEQSLLPFAKSTDYTPHLRVRGWPRTLDRLVCNLMAALCVDEMFSVLLQTILDNSNSPYAQYFASSSLLQIVTEQPVRCVCCWLLLVPAAQLPAWVRRCTAALGRRGKQLSQLWRAGPMSSLIYAITSSSTWKRAICELRLCFRRPLWVGFIVTLRVPALHHDPACGLSMSLVHVQALQFCNLCTAVVRARASAGKDRPYWSTLS